MLPSWPSRTSSRFSMRARAVRRGRRSGSPACSPSSLHARIARAAEGGSTHRLRGWSVGAVIGNETFVQARPIVRDPKSEPVEDVLRTPAPCTIASFQAGTDDERFAESNPSIRMARFRRWVGVRAEPELDGETRRRNPRRDSGLSRTQPDARQRR